MTEEKWIQWIGKKHVFGDDPTTDDGCDCFVMAVRVRELFGLTVPSEEEVKLLLSFAEQKKNVEVFRFIRGRTVRLEKMELGSFSYVFSLSNICVYSCVGDGILEVHHEKGVRWLSASGVKPKLCWYHWQ